jgi:hypothetical protein
MASRTGEGGGLGNRNVTHVKAPKTEPVAQAVSPGAVSRMGAVVGEGTPRKPIFSGPGYSSPRGPTDMSAAGPGAGRTVYRAGSQAATPRPTPMGDGRSLFQNSPLKGRGEP